MRASKTKIRVVNLTEIAKQYGGIFAFLVVLSFLIISNIEKIANAWVKVKEYFNRVEKVEKEQVRKPLTFLLNHKLFDKLDFLGDYQYKFETHGEIDKAKSRAFSRFLRIKMDSTTEYIQSIISEASYGMGKAELEKLVRSKFSACNMNVKKSLAKEFSNHNISPQDADELIGLFFDSRRVVMEKYDDVFNLVFGGADDEDEYALIKDVLLLVYFEATDIKEQAIKAFEDKNGAFMKYLGNDRAN